MAKTLDQIKAEWQLSESELSRIVDIAKDILFSPEFILANNEVIAEIESSLDDATARTKALKNWKGLVRMIASTKRYLRHQFLSDYERAAALTQIVKSCGMDLQPMFTLQEAIWNAPDTILERSGWATLLANHPKPEDLGFKKYEPKPNNPLPSKESE